MQHARRSGWACVTLSRRLLDSDIGKLAEGDGRVVEGTLDSLSRAGVCGRPRAQILDVPLPGRERSARCPPVQDA